MHRYSYTSLKTLAAELLGQNGIPDEPARLIAETLVEGDLMGHTTHGLALLPAYLQELDKGAMKPEGRPVVLSESETNVVWDGEYLSGVYLTRLAVREALTRSADQPVVTYVIRRAHHIACLAAYMQEIIEAGRVGILMASDPAAQLVAPFGGKDSLYSPNPIAAGIPAGPNGPVILDISTSVTAAGVVNRHKQAGTLLPGKWLLTKDGNPTDDPGALDDGGSILPLGGLDVGYKGFALGLLVEALTSGLGGFGRAEEPSNWGTSVFLQVLNPDAFSGSAALEKEMSWLTRASREMSTRPEVDSVRVPGDRALALRKEQLAQGVPLDAALLDTIQSLCREKNIRFPEEM